MSEYDTNYDGVADTVLHDTFGDGVADVVAIDADQSGVAEQFQVDTNNDSIIDTYVRDTNENGTVDVIAVDSNQDGHIDGLITDTDENGRDDTADAQLAHFDPNVMVIGPPSYEGLDALTIHLAEETGTATFGPVHSDSDGIPDSLDSHPHDATRWDGS